jgi:hypothetical protein
VWVIAHGIVGRADLPIPTELFGVGAALVLVLSFLALAAGWSRPRLERVPERVLLRVPVAVEAILGAAGVAAFAATVWAGLEGTSAQSANLAPTAVYVGFWIAVPFASLVLGDVFRLLSPWRAVGRYGVEPWTRRADAFGVWFGMFARLAPLARRDDGRLVLRPPVAGAARLRAIAGTTAVLVIGIGSTGFDGAKEGPLFNDLAGTIQDALTGAGLTKGFALELAFVVGLLVAVALVGAIWRLGTLGMPPAGDGRTALARRFVHALIPIAAAYLVAHYFSLLAYNGQDLWRLASDPLGNGADYFGGAGATIDYSVVSATAIWYVQTGALVLGHVAGLVLAHDRALAVYGSPRAATRSQLVMLVVMVLFTLLGMWLLSAALNT